MATTLLEFIARDTASRHVRGMTEPSQMTAARRLGAHTSKRGNLIASTVCAAISSGVTRLTAAQVGHAGGELGLGEARHHDRDLDAGAAQLGADGFGEADHAVLGGAVGRQARGGGAAGQRGDVDDVAGAARAHAPHRLLRAVDDGVQVDLELAGDARLVLLVERRDHHDPGVVDEDVERAEALLDLVEEGGEAAPVGHVEGEADRAVGELGGGGLGGGGVEIADGDHDPLAGERAGERLTDAAGAARDDGDLAAQRAGSLGHDVNYGEPTTSR